MAYDVESYFYPRDSYFSLMSHLGTSLEVVECLACGALVTVSRKKFHYEFHLSHRDLPRQNNR
jgi:hypothetical protein